MGADWEEDWFEDYEEGDQLDGSVRLIAIAAQTWWAALSPLSGEVLGSDS
jgi:hypothetical protein